MYAVVKERHSAISGDYRFTRLYKDFEEAKAEAMMLSEKENFRVCVFKMIGIVDRKPLPVEWTDCE